MEGHKKQHFPSIQRNLDQINKEIDPFRSVTGLKSAEDENLSGTGLDFTSGTDFPNRAVSSEKKVRALRRKKVSAATPSDHPKTSTTVTSISKITLQDENLLQQAEQYLLTNQTIKLLFKKNGITEDQGKAAILDCVFMSSLKKLQKNSQSNKPGLLIPSLVDQRAKQMCELAAIKNSCSNKENKISNMIENRLKVLAACLP